MLIILLEIFAMQDYYGENTGTFHTLSKTGFVTLVSYKNSFVELSVVRIWKKPRKYREYKEGIKL